VDQSSAGEPGGIVVIDSFFPNELSGLGFEGVIPADLIAEQKRVPVTVGNHDHGRTNGSIRVEGPLDAAALRTQSMDRAAGAAHEKLAIEECGKREGVDVALVPESPLQLESLHLIDAQSCDFGRHEAGVIALGTPTVPDEFGPVVDRDSAIFAEGIRRQCGFSALRPEKLRHRLTLFARQRVSDLHHWAEVQHF